MSALQVWFLTLAVLLVSWRVNEVEQSIERVAIALEASK